eukprot:RCo010798
MRVPLLFPFPSLLRMPSMHSAFLRDVCGTLDDKLCDVLSIASSNDLCTALLGVLSLTVSPRQVSLRAGVPVLFRLLRTAAVPRTVPHDVHDGLPNQMLGAVLPDHAGQARGRQPAAAVS